MSKEPSYSNEIKILLEKIMDIDANGGNITVEKIGGVLHAEAKFSKNDDGLTAYNRLQQAGVTSESSQLSGDNKEFTGVYKFEFPETSETLITLQKQMERGISKRIVEDIQKSSIDFGSYEKHNFAERILKQTAQELGVELGKSTDRGRG